MDLFIDPLLLAGAVLIVMAIWLCLRYFVPSTTEAQRFFIETMNEHQKNKWAKIAERGPTVRALQSLMLLVAVNFRNSPMTEYRRKINKQLQAGGYPMALNFETYLGLIIVSTTGFGFLGCLMGFGMTKSINLPVMFVMMVIGLFLPTQWLKEKTARRRWLVAKDLPYKVDLLTLSIEAGMDFQSALENLVERDNTDNPLREELFMTLQEIHVGKTRREALRDMAGRLQIESLSTLVGNIIQGEAMGTPIGHVLKTQSEMMRVHRTHRAEKLAGEAPVKIIFPLLFIFVAVFLVLFGSIIVRGMRGELGL